MKTRHVISKSTFRKKSHGFKTEMVVYKTKIGKRTYSETKHELVKN